MKQWKLPQMTQIQITLITSCITSRPLTPSLQGRAGETMRREPLTSDL